MPDYVSSGTYGSTDGVGAKQRWGEQTRGLLGKRKCEEEIGSTQKKPRVKSHHFLCALDNVLQECAGKRLLDFVPPPASPYTDWPYLCLATDQGPDVRCAAYYLRYGLSCNVDFWFDPSHGVWRDYETAQGACNLLTFARLMLAAFNFAHAPWDEALRGGQLAQAWP
eukprot:6070899-Amphidinium_carterae.1